MKRWVELTRDDPSFFFTRFFHAVLICPRQPNPLSLSLSLGNQGRRRPPSPPRRRLPRPAAPADRQSTAAGSRKPAISGLSLSLSLKDPRRWL